ncbi:MAG: TfoX/Sxy family protein [Rhodobacteraceae bacterium]|nr:TfoX/Sxy family protein [Paracoccaceae bacterium]
MAYDEALAQILRDDLRGEDAREQKMFGGLCFLMRGNMVAGVYSGGGMFRIAKEDRAAALAVPGAAPILMGKAGREMAGMVGLAAEAMPDDAARARLLGMALGLVRTLPPK